MRKMAISLSLLMALVGCGGGGTATSPTSANTPGIVKSGRNLEFHNLSSDGRTVYGGDGRNLAFVWNDREPPKYIPFQTVSDKKGVAFGSSPDRSKTWLIVGERIYTYALGEFTPTPVFANMTSGPYPNGNGSELLVNSSTPGYWDGSFFEPFKIPNRYVFQVVAASDDLTVAYGEVDGRIIRYVRGVGYKFFQSREEANIEIQQATGDGQAFVGWIQNPTRGTSAILWRDGLYEVIRANTDTQSASAVGTDQNGEVVVGTLGQTSWVWTRATGAVDLLTYLANHPSVAELQTYRQLVVQAISRDAKMILVKAFTNSNSQLIKIYL